MRFLHSFAYVFAVLCFLMIAQPAFAADNYVCAVYFTGVGCPHCANTDPYVLQQWLSDYDNLVVIEYEIYQQSQNANLIYQYDENYGTGLGVPMIILSSENSMRGDTPIIENFPAFMAYSGYNYNPCQLVSGSSDFTQLDINSLPSLPKIWHKDRILVKKSESSGQSADDSLLKSLLFSDDCKSIVEQIGCQRTEPEHVELSGKRIEFGNAALVGDWLFMWEGSECSCDDDSADYTMLFAGIILVAAFAMVFYIFSRKYKFRIKK